MKIADKELKARADRIESLMRDIETITDPATRATVTGVVRDLLTLYGEGLSRVLAHVRADCPPEVTGRLLDQFANDELISHLLLLHDLHPVDVETRVLKALDDVRPYLQSHGGNVELLGVSGGIAHLRLQGSCDGCPSSTVTLKLAIEEAIMAAAPDLDGIDAEGVVESPGPTTGFVPMASIAVSGNGRHAAGKH